MRVADLDESGVCRYWSNTIVASSLCPRAPEIRHIMACMFGQILVTMLAGIAAMREARADGGLLRATRVDHVALAVGDIDKALVFYRSLFGNEVLKDSRTQR